jgi:hypothetical protein
LNILYRLIRAISLRPIVPSSDRPLVPSSLPFPFSLLSAFSSSLPRPLVPSFSHHLTFLFDHSSSFLPISPPDFDNSSFSYVFSNNPGIKLEI